MNWHGPILTDSGGFQVMSLSDLRKMSEDGVTFKSHLDGKRHHLTPERSMQIQHLLDGNVTMCLDECTPFPATARGRGEEHEAQHALGAALAATPSSSGPATGCSASSRAASIPICGRKSSRR